MGIVLFITVYVVYLSILSLVALKRKALKQTPYYIKPIKPNKKIVKIATVIYILSCLAFYISRVNTYLLSDRPYKEAKAYAIAGEYLQIYQVAIGSFKTADTFYYKALQYLQREFVLKNIYRFIPETDGEREIWNYKFQQYIYARSFWGPVIQENIRKNFGLLYGFASFEPWMKDLINNIYTSIIKLDTLPIKDEEFSKIDRYLVIAAMAPYYERYFRKEINTIYDDKVVDKMEDGRPNTHFTNPYYIERYTNFLKAVDDAKEAMDNNKDLSKAFDDNPTIKALLYWAGVNAYANKNRSNLYTYEQYICNTNDLDKYVEYQGGFLDWINEPKSSFKKLSQSTQKTYKFVINDSKLHYTAKYICDKKFNSYSWEENGLIHLYGIDNLEKEMHKSFTSIYYKSIPEEKLISLTKQLKQDFENNQTQGEDNGAR